MITYCADCEYWFKQKTNETGICRRKSPEPIHNDKGGAFIGFFNFRVIWPFTRSVDCCGEGEIRTTPDEKPEELEEVTQDQTVEVETKPQKSKFDELVKIAEKSLKRERT